MKKLMFVAAAIAAGVAVADVTSANVVGYNTVARPCAYACYGSAFVKPGQTSFTLAELDITWTAASPALKNQATSRKNFIQFFSTGTALNLDATRAYYKCLADGEWYQKDISPTATSANDTLIADPSKVSFDAGQGFMCSLGTTSAKVMFAGEVITGGEAKTLTVNRPCAYFVAGNPSATDITLADIDITWTAASPALKNQATSRKNFIQYFTNGTALNLDPARAYYKCLADGKWYKKDTDASATSADDVEIDPTKIAIKAGEGFLCSFGTTSAKITMATSL